MELVNVAQRFDELKDLEISVFLDNRFTKEGREIKVKFFKENFAHLVGLHYLSNVYTDETRIKSYKNVLNQLKKGNARTVNTFKNSLHYHEINDRIYFFSYILWSLVSAKTAIQVSGIKNPYSKIEADFLFVCEFSMNTEIANSSKERVVKFAHFYLRESDKLSGIYVPISFHVKDNKIMHWPSASEVEVKSVNIVRK